MPKEDGERGVDWNRCLGRPCSRGRMRASL